LAATGKIGSSGPPAPPSAPPPPKQTFSLTNLAVQPQVVTPAVDGSGDLVTVSLTLGMPSTVTAAVLDATGNPVATVLDEQLPAGNDSFSWPGHVLPDGQYTLAATATAGTKTVTKGATFTVDRTLSGLQVSPAEISPN